MNQGRRETDKPRTVYRGRALTCAEHEILRAEEKELLKEVIAASLLLDDLALPQTLRPYRQVERTLDVLDVAYGSHRDDGPAAPDRSHPPESSDVGD